MKHKTSVKLNFYTDKELTKEEVQDLHVHIFHQMTLNRQKSGDFLIGSKWSILNEKDEPIVAFDNSGRAYAIAED